MRPGGQGEKAPGGFLRRPFTHEPGEGKGIGELLLGGGEGESSLRTDHGIEGALEGRLVGPDSDDVVAIVGYASGDRPALQTEAEDEADCGRRGAVAVDHRDFQLVAARVSAEPTGGVERRPHTRPVRDDFPVPCLNRQHRAIGVTARVQILRGDRAGAEDIEGRDRPGLGPRESPFGDEAPVDPGLFDVEVFGTGHHHEVRRVTLPEKANGEAVVAHGMEGGGPESHHRVDPESDGAADHPVDMALDEVIGMPVVATEEATVGSLLQERPEGLEIAGGGSFPDGDEQSGGDLLAGLLEGGGLVVGGDPGRGVTAQILAPDARRVPVEGNPALAGHREDRLHGGIPADHRGEVHDLGEVEDLGAVEKARNFFGPEGGTGRIERGRGYAGGGAPGDLHGRIAPGLDHPVDPGHPGHVADLVRVADGGHGAVHRGEASELGRAEQRALDVEVGVDEPGCEEGPGGSAGILPEVTDPARLDAKTPREKDTAVDIGDEPGESRGRPRGSRFRVVHSVIAIGLMAARRFSTESMMKSGVEAPAVTPTTAYRRISSSSIWSAVSMW